MFGLFSKREDGQASPLKSLLVILFVIASLAAAAGVFYALFQKAGNQKVLRFKKRRRPYRSSDIEAEQDIGPEDAPEDTQPTADPEG